jgi:hypothetical protein
MNEQIRQLIKQADLDSDMFPVDEGWEYPELQKFAELIVQKCAQVLWNMDSGELHDEYVESLKKHFGIK